MNQTERRIYLINSLLKERGEKNYKIPHNAIEQKQLLRSLFNIRMPKEADTELLKIQDEYLRAEIEQKGITRLSDLQPIENDIYLWQGDITTLECDAIVNAANSQMLGCFHPLHNCIDNCIHTFSGIALRNKCNELMKQQGYDEPTGQAKITPAYNLPCQYILHTVGPIANGKLTENDCNQLRSCYLSCLKLAEENRVNSIAFCCISTGVFGFPQYEAAEIAVAAVKEYKQKANSDIKVIFNVFKDDDLFIYRGLLNH